MQIYSNPPTAPPSPVSHPVSGESLDLIAARFRILGEPMRLKLIAALHDGEKNVTELMTATKAHQANVSRHLQTLIQAGILGRRKSGLHVIYYIADDSIFSLCALVCGSIHKQIAAQAKIMQPTQQDSAVKNEFSP